MKTELIGKLTALKNKIVSEARDFTSAEKRQAEKWLDELDEIESRDFFDTTSLGSSHRPREAGSGLDGDSKGRSKGPFQTLGEQLVAVRNAALPGGQTDKRLYRVAEARAATGLSQSVPSDGGFLIDPVFSNEILTNAMDAAPLLPLLNRYPLSSNSLIIPGEDESSRADGSRHGGVRGYWLAEAAEKTASKPKFRQIQLSLNKVVVLIYATDELLGDAPALDRYIRQVGADEIAFKVQDAVVRGSGAGQPLGILNAGCTVEVSKQTGQAASTIVWENLTGMWKRMLARSRKSAIWLINQDVEDQLYSMSLSVGVGGVPVYMPAGGASAQPYASLLGRPIVPVEQCETLGTKGDILLIDPKSYILADRGQVQTDVSIHCRFIYDESVFRLVYRVDGQPAMQSAITPFKGTNTLSPFVALETRS